MQNTFTISYHPEAGELVVRLFGRALADDEMAWLAGALDGAEVVVSKRKIGLYLAVQDASRFEAYETSIRSDADGSLWAYIHDVRTAAGKRGQGLGIQAFARQVQMARALGLSRFELWAAGHPGDQTHNGWLTWAKFGFDAPLTTHDLQLLPNNLRAAQTVNDLMAVEEGISWWTDNGAERSMIFELHDDSSMMRQFRRYLKSKGLRL